MYLRKGNLKFTVTQNNAERRLLVDDLVKVIDERRDGDYFGYQPTDLVGHDFRELLPEEVSEILNDNIEFNLEGNDLKTVLEKIISFKVLTSARKEIDMNAYIERSISTSDKLSFSVILERKIFLQEKIKSVLASIALYQQVTHDLTGLINPEAFYDVLDELMDFLYETRVEAVLCIISIEGFSMMETHDGKEKMDDVISRVGKVMGATLRTKDIIGYLGGGKFAVLMVRTFEDEVIYPLKRLETNFIKEGILTPKITYNVRYQTVDMENKAKDMVEIVKDKQIDHSINPTR